MKTAVLTAFCVALMRCATAEDPTAALPGVQDLSPGTFDLAVNGKVHALVEFYAPWCGHCKSLAPEYKKLGEICLSDPAVKGRVIIAKVNADEHRDLGKKFGVTGFPTLKWFSRGEDVTSPEDYRGGRTADKMLEFIKGKVEADKMFGRVDVLDSIVSNFLKGDRDAIIQQVESKLKDLPEKDQGRGEMYLKVMRSVKAKGDDYLTTEHARVTRLIDSGNVNQDKVIELSQKISILSAFIPEQ